MHRSRQPRRQQDLRLPSTDIGVYHFEDPDWRSRVRITYAGRCSENPPAIRRWPSAIV